MFRRKWTALTCALLMILAGACGSSSNGNAAGSSGSSSTGSADTQMDPKIISAAKKEHSVTLYTDWGETQYKDAVAAFEKAYGIKVTVVRDVYLNLGPKIDLELKSGKGIADAIIFSTSDPFDKYGAAGDLVKPVGPAFEGKTDYNDKEYVDTKTNAFEVGGVVPTFVWNTDSVPDGIHSWDDFLDKSLSGGKIAIQPPISENNAEWWISAEKAAGKDWMNKLAAQKPKVYDSAVPMNEAIVSGEVFATPRGFPTLVNASKKQGAPIDYAKTPDSVSGTRHRGAVLKTSKHQDAAWLLFDYVLSEPGQKSINVDGSGVLPGVGIEENSKLPPDMHLSDKQLADYQAKWNKLFGTNS